MGRVTRKKAAEIAEQLHVDEDAVLDANAENAAIKAKPATPEHASRSPLAEIAPNSADSKEAEAEQEPVEELKQSTRGRKAGKRGGAKGKKNTLAASTATPLEEVDVVPNDDESAPSPASENAAQDWGSARPELQSGVEISQDRSQSPPSAAVRLTRSQLAKKAEVETEPKNLVDGLGQTSEEHDGYLASNSGNPTIETTAPTDMSENVTANTMEPPASPLPTAVPIVIRNLRTDTPAKRSTSNKENVQPESDASSMATPGQRSSVYDALEDAVVAAATPPRSEEQASPRPEDPIAALDELDDAVENVSKDIPEVQDSPAKPKARKDEQISASPKSAKDQDAPKAEEKRRAETKKDSKKTAPVVRTTKAAQARISMAQNKDVTSKAPGMGRPRPSTTLGRWSSVRQSVAPKAEGATKRVPSNPVKPAAVASKSLKTSASDEPREKKDVAIPHSKPRPISLSFTKPPPPPKSTKATTSSTFQLPGEAVAAKLKAVREARMAKEAEEADKKDKKPAFKARPAPKSTGEAPSVRQTNASRARESIMTGKPAPPFAAAAHKRSNTVVNARTASKDASTKPTILSASTGSRPRPSTSLADISKQRSSLHPTVSTKPTASSTSTAQRNVSGSGTSKGKEVFARLANAKAAAEKEKSEKEAAAKKARAEAAERGRVASREWAEKQRLRKLGGKKVPEGKSQAGAADVKAGAEVEAAPAVQIGEEGGAASQHEEVVDEAAPAGEVQAAAAA